MSLIFAAAIENWSIANAELMSPSMSAVSPSRDQESIPLAGIIDHARGDGSLAHPTDAGDICIPLHERDSATLTDAYVIYTDHPIHGEIFIYDEDGERDFVDIDEFGTTPLAQRLRFWHSDYVPETEPEYYDSPLSDTEPPRNPIADPEEFFDRLLAFVENEREARRSEHRSQLDYQSPTAIYEAGGSAIPTLIAQQTARGEHYKLSVSPELLAKTLPSERTADRNGETIDLPYRFVQNEFRIHEGNEVLLEPPSRANAPSAFPLAATVDAIHGRDVYLSIDREQIAAVNDVRSFLNTKRSGFGLVLLLNDVPYEREATAIRELRQDRTFSHLMTGQTAITFTDVGALESTQHDEDLNQEQQLAVEHALLADPLFCIHGPPGTGKTRTLVEIIRRAATAGQRVLVCADSNQAIDNILAGDSTLNDADAGSLHASGQHGSGAFTINRINARRSAHPVVTRYYDQPVTGLPDVVVATASSAARIDQRFDLVVVDEATQTTCTATCIPMAKAEKVILAGDHKQLPPFSASDEPPESVLGMSLFEHLYADGGIYEGVGIQLRTQYRMHRDIARFPNRWFYDRSLRHGRDIAPAATESVDVVGERESVMGYDIGGTEETLNHSIYNEQEAELVTYIVGQLLTLPSFDADDIGVITPYTAQVKTIKSMTTQYLSDATGVTVDTIDSFQGGERAAIVISLVRSNPTGDSGFLGRKPDGPRRLNVALTRARQFCGIVGDWSTLTTRAYADDCTDLYRSLRSELADTNRLKTVDPMMIDVSRIK